MFDILKGVFTTRVIIIIGVLAVTTFGGMLIYKNMKIKSLRSDIVKLKVDLELTDSANKSNLLEINRLVKKISSINDILAKAEGKNKASLERISKLELDKNKKVQELNEAFKKIKSNEKTTNSNTTIQDCYDLPLPDDIISIFLQASGGENSH